MLIVLGRVNGGFPGSSAGKESACNAGDPVSIPGSGRSLGEGIGYLLQYSPSLENPHGQRCLVEYSPWGCKESAMTKRLSTAHRVSSEWAPYCALGPVKAFVLIALVLTTPLKGCTVPTSALLMELRTPPRLRWKAQTCFLLLTKGFTSKPQGTELGHRVYFLLLNSSGMHFPILLQATDAKIHFHILSLWFKEILIQHPEKWREGWWWVLGPILSDDWPGCSGRLWVERRSKERRLGKQLLFNGSLIFTNLFYIPQGRFISIGQFF